MRRDINYEYDRLVRWPGGSGPPMFADAPPRRRGTDRADQIHIRFVYFPVETISAQFNVGVAGAFEEAQEVAVLGGAVRAMVAENGPFRLSAQFDAHFVPEFQQHSGGISPSLGPYQAHGELDVYEYGFSLIGSMSADLTESCCLMTYVGPRLSAYRGEMGSYADYSDSGDRFFLSGVAKQASLFGMVVGSRLDWGDHWYARVEGRLVEEQSLSVGLGSSW